MVKLVNGVLNQLINGEGGTTLKKMRKLCQNYLILPHIFSLHHLPHMPLLDDMTG